jgi:tripartite-type tricarboxylate transporter receptor subunit TctC
MTNNYKFLAAAALGLFATLPAQAQSYPDKPLRVLHGFAAGGNADVVSRIVTTEMGKSLGQPLVVEPKSGAGGVLAADTVAKSKADGYTLLVATGGHAIAAALQPRLPYDTATAFQPVSALTSFPFLVMVNSSSKYKTLQDLLRAAKAKPSTLNFGSAGVGTGQHMVSELLMRSAAVSMTHVSYRGESAAITALLSNDIDFIAVAPTAAVAHVKSGKLRALATSGSKRWPGLPDVPTVAEQGLPNFEVRSWTALLAPAGTPKEVIYRLNTEVRAALGNESVRLLLQEATGGDVQASSPDELKASIAADVKRWSRLVVEAKLSAE